MSELEGQLLRVGFRRYDGTFAGGQKANNKTELDYDTLARHPRLLDRVVELMCEEAESYNPDFFVGVPDGATNLAGRVAREYGAYHVSLRRVSKEEMGYKTEIDRSSIAHLGDGVLIEDVLNQLTNTRRALMVEGLDPKILAVIGILNRGMPGEQQPISKPIHSLVTRSIPAILPPSDELWALAK